VNWAELRREKEAQELDFDDVQSSPASSVLGPNSASAQPFAEACPCS
jgi:hypothetical protein